MAAVPLLALERPPWQRAPGDRWIEVDDLKAAAEALGAAPLPLPDAEVIVARGPFDRAGDRAMLANYRAEIVVARNAGGDAASAKIEAARDLALPVVMVRRPFVPARAKVETVAEVLRWLGHDKTPAERGV
jgi:precorrin-6A/cobalt-precorrin-6A reductase